VCSGIITPVQVVSTLFRALSISRMIKHKLRLFWLMEWAQDDGLYALKFVFKANIPFNFYQSIIGHIINDWLKDSALLYWLKAAKRSSMAYNKQVLKGERPRPSILLNISFKYSYTGYSPYQKRKRNENTIPHITLHWNVTSLLY